MWTRQSCQVRDLYWHMRIYLSNLVYGESLTLESITIEFFEVNYLSVVIIKKIVNKPHILSCINLIILFILHINIKIIIIPIKNIYIILNPK